MTTIIKTLATAAATTLREEAPRARERILDAADIAYAVRQHLAVARRLARTEPTTVVRTTLAAGYVANGYKYRAEADRITITGRKVAEIVIEAERATAQSRPHGRGATLLVRAVSVGQTQGRIVVSR